MATISFDRDIIITEPKAVEKIIDMLSQDETMKENPKMDIKKELKRGEKLLKKFSSHLKK